MSPASKAKICLLVGLVLVALSFAMLDREWLTGFIRPLGPVDHPLAAIIGLIGLGTCICGARLMRRAAERS